MLRLVEENTTRSYKDNLILEEGEEVVTPRLTSYNGITDPEDNFQSFHTGMEDITILKDLWCRIFRKNLLGNTIGWYPDLPPQNIQTFEDLDREGLPGSFRISYLEEKRN